MRSRIELSGWIGLPVVVGALLGGFLSPDPVAAQAPTRGLTAKEAANHVLSRLAFGPGPKEVESVTATGWRRWVEKQLHPETIEEGSLPKTLAKRCPSLTLSLSELHELAQDEKNERGRLKDELRSAVLLRAVYSPRQFQEVMVEFWRNHLNIDVNKVPGLANHYEENVLRRYAFGTFPDLLLACAKHPAMLVYLDNYVSSKRGLNENYARELMELHTLGVDNGYTQQDVIALAKVLTGWTCGWRTGRGGEREYAFFFNPQMHDNDPVSVVGLKLNQSPGVAEGERALRHLATHPGTARFIATKLCRYLVNDAPSPQLIEHVAQVFLDTGGDLPAVYRAILFSPDFMDPKNYRAKFKTPFQFTVSTLRTLSARIESPQEIFRELRLMGQPIYECEEPPGYSYQREAWLDPGVMVYLWNFAIQLVTDKISGIKISRTFIDELARVPLASRPRKVMDLVLPAVRDNQTQRLVFQTSDASAMVAWALGSPSFQQH